MLIQGLPSNLNIYLWKACWPGDLLWPELWGLLVTQVKPSRSKDAGELSCNCFRTFPLVWGKRLSFLWDMWCVANEYTNVTCRVKMVGHPQSTMFSTCFTAFVVGGCKGSQVSVAGTFGMPRSCLLQKELFSNYLRLASYPFCCLSSEEGCMPISNVAIWFALPWKCQPERLWGYSCLLSKC